jgi:pilus assembly protein Flp/PilA
MKNIGSFLTRNFRSFLANNTGATAIEYAVMASGIAMAVVATISLLSDRVRAIYESIAAALA